MLCPACRYAGRMHSETSGQQRKKAQGQEPEVAPRHPIDIATLLRRNSDPDCPEAMEK